MKKLLLIGLLFGACASLDRDEAPVPPMTDVEQPPGKPPTTTYPDPTPDAGMPPDTCQPECECDNDCDENESCDEDKCHKRCECDDDCSGPDNNSCDNGLCKGHNN